MPPQDDIEYIYDEEIDPEILDAEGVNPFDPNTEYQEDESLDDVGDLNDLPPEEEYPDLYPDNGEGGLEPYPPD